MKGLHKYILISIIEHATPDDFGQFLLLFKNVEKDFKGVVKVLQRVKKYRLSFSSDGIFYYEGKSLQFAKYQTQTLCNVAVRNRGIELIYVNNQTEEMCLEAVKQCGLLVYHVKNQTPEICREAIKNDPKAKRYIRIKYEGSP